MDGQLEVPGGRYFFGPSIPCGASSIPPFAFDVLGPEAVETSEVSGWLNQSSGTF